MGRQFIRPRHRGCLGDVKEPPLSPKYARACWQRKWCFAPAMHPFMQALNRTKNT